MTDKPKQTRKKKKEVKSAIRKCPVCGESGQKDQMVQHESRPKRYMHKGCVPIHEMRLKEEAIETEKRRVEQAEKDSCWETISEIYDVKYDLIPNRFFSMITSLREGNPVYKKRKFDKRFKDGFSYPIIERTYREARDDIEYSINTKEFETTTQALYYGIRIIVDRIPMVKRKYEREMRSKEVAEIKKQNEELDTRRLDFMEKQEKEAKKPMKTSDSDFDVSKFI